MERESTDSVVKKVLEQFELANQERLEANLRLFHEMTKLVSFSYLAEMYISQSVGGEKSIAEALQVAPVNTVYNELFKEVSRQIGRERAILSTRATMGLALQRFEVPRVAQRLINGENEYSIEQSLTKNYADFVLDAGVTSRSIIREAKSWQEKINQVDNKPRIQIGGEILQMGCEILSHATGTKCQANQLKDLKDVPENLRGLHKELIEVQLTLAKLKG